MGMFDTIFVKAELPLTEELKQLDVKWNELDYQTKSLENCMSAYEITKEGDLMAISSCWWEKGFNGENTQPKPEPVKVPCHGKILFYDYIQDKGGHDWFIEFNAYFTYGKLDKIEVENIDKTPVQERLAQEMLWELRRKQREKSFSYRIKKALRKIPFYSKAIRGIGNMANKIGNKIYMITIRCS